MDSLTFRNGPGRQRPAAFEQRMATLRRGLRELFPRLAAVSPTPPGLPGDGLTPRGGAPLDLPAGDHAATLKDALEA